MHAVFDSDTKSNYFLDAVERSRFRPSRVGRLALGANAGYRPLEGEYQGPPSY